MSDLDNNSDHSDSDDSQSSQSSSEETIVDPEEQNRRLREQVQALMAALKKKNKDADEKANRRNSSTTPKVNTSVSLSLAQKPKVFEVHSNKNLSELKLHEHLETIKSHVSGGNDIPRDALAGTTLLNECTTNHRVTLRDRDKTK